MKWFHDTENDMFLLQSSLTRKTITDGGNPLEKITEALVTINKNKTPLLAKVNRKSWVLAEITEKEYCQAKKVCIKFNVLSINVLWLHFNNQLFNSFLGITV
jgi:hypothetical protein